MTKKKTKTKPPGRGLKLTWDDVEAIRKFAATGRYSPKDLAQKYGVHPSTITDIVAHRTWKGKRPGPLKGRKTGRAPANKTVAPDKGKAFRKKVREAKGKKHRGKPLSIEKYNEMYMAYTVEQSGAHVARTCGVSARVANKYIREGDPTRNLRPLRDRLEAVLAEEQTEQDYGLEMIRKDMKRAAKLMFEQVEARIKSINPEELDADQITKFLKDLQGVLERTVGVADATVQVKGEGRFDSWTNEELLAFFQTGTFPAHDIMATPAGRKKG